MRSVSGGPGLPNEGGEDFLCLLFKEFLVQGGEDFFCILYLLEEDEDFFVFCISFSRR